MKAGSNGIKYLTEAQLGQLIKAGTQGPLWATGDATADPAHACSAWLACHRGH